MVATKPEKWVGGKAEPGENDFRCPGHDKGERSTRIPEKQRAIGDMPGVNGREAKEGKRGGRS